MSFKFFKCIESKCFHKLVKKKVKKILYNNILPLIRCVKSERLLLKLSIVQERQIWQVFTYVWILVVKSVAWKLQYKEPQRLGIELDMGRGR